MQNSSNSVKSVSSLSISFIIIQYIYAFVLVSSAIYCPNPYQCVNQILDDDKIFIKAYKGANGPGTSMIGQGKCSGAFSCHSMRFIHSEELLICHGTHSCSNTTIVSNTAPIYCRSCNSCMFSNITSTNNGTPGALHCSGYFGCAETFIQSIETIYADGQYSLYKSIIDTSNAITITLSGDYAGYGATIKCRENYQCDIYCDGDTSCYMLFIDCIGHCIIHNRSEHTILPITDIMEFQSLLDGYIIMFETIAFSNDEECTASNKRFDSFIQKTGENIIVTQDNEGPICCRGEDSCRGINRIEYESNAKGNIICSGSKACDGSNITSNNGSVFCEGWVSCRYSKIYNAAFIYCIGMTSCGDSIITSSRSVLCAAKFACRDAMVMSEGSDLTIYFGAFESGEGAKIYCNETDLCDIICTGYSSCVDITLICDGRCTVKCDAESECPLRRNASTTIDLTRPMTISPTEFIFTPTQLDVIHDVNGYKKSNFSFINIILVLSMSLLSIIGAVICYCIHRSKKRKIFENINDKIVDNGDNDGVKHIVRIQEDGHVDREGLVLNKVEWVVER